MVDQFPTCAALEGIFAISELPHDDLGTLMGSVALLSGAAGAAGPILAALVVDATSRSSNAAILAAVFAALAALVLPTHPTRDGARLHPRV